MVVFKPEGWIKMVFKPKGLVFELAEWSLNQKVGMIVVFKSKGGA